METYYNPEDLAKFGTIGEKASELAEKFFAYYNAVFEEGTATVRALEASQAMGRAA